MKNRYNNLLLSFLGLLAIAVIIAFIINFSNQPISNQSKHWGEFGDYIGGVFGILAFLGVLYTVYLQQMQIRIQQDQMEILREDLRLSREEIKRSAKAQEESQKALLEQAKIQKYSGIINGNSIVAEILYKDLEKSRNGRRQVFFNSHPDKQKDDLDTAVVRIIEYLNKLRNLTESTEGH